jgi:hypothetical protein
MSFSYLAGVTTAGAADEIVDWFTTFQAWMVSMGWTVAAGGGTQDITFRSVSEAGGLTMLYLRAWRDGVFVDRVNFRVQDDLAGTHVTTPAAGCYVDSGGVQFAYWMSGDMDAIVVCFKLAGGYRHIRNHTGLWDVDSTLYYNAYMSDNLLCPFDSSASLGGTYFGQATANAGQLKHISCWIQNAPILAEDTIATGRPGATTSWVVLADNAGKLFAIRTAGVLPTGIPDGTFSSAAGAAATPLALLDAISAVITPLGWTDLGDPGFQILGRLWHSTGESGEENIYVSHGQDWFASADRWYIYVQDDAVGTHQVGCYGMILAGDYPVNYWISADRDCVALVVQRATGYHLWWNGMCAPFAAGFTAPYTGPSLSEYSMICTRRGAGLGNDTLLRGHDGAWAPVINVSASEGVPANNSNPNAFDGTTYLVWPFVAYWGAVQYSPVGQMKYYYHSHGGGIANMDTITVGARVYTVFFDQFGDAFCIRTT